MLLSLQGSILHTKKVFVNLMVTTKQSLYVVLQKIIKKESKHTTGENHLITIKDCNLGTKKERE